MPETGSRTTTFSSPNGFGWSRSDAADKSATLLCWFCAALIFGVFGWITFDLLQDGLSAIDAAFLTDSVADAGRSGGIGPIIVSTLLILAVCMVSVLPIGLGTAILLSEFTRSSPRLVTWVRASLDILAGVPSIVFGLFGNAFFCVYLGLGFSILSGGLTLACMVLPLLIRATEEGLRAVPDDYRQAAAALAMSRPRMILSILLPAATPGLLVGFVLGTGRALAETAALIFTSGYVSRLPESLNDSGRALSVHIYDLAMNVPGGEQNAFATALVLVGLLLFINLVSMGILRLWRTRQQAT